MGRIRTIKPEFPQSESIGRLSRDARLLFIQLWTIVDDSGRSRAASRMLASLLFPYDDDAPRLIDGWIAELQAEEIINLYEIDGSTYLEVVNWLKHQKVDHPTPSKIPPYSREFEKHRENSRSLAPDLGPRTKDLGEGRVLNYYSESKTKIHTVTNNCSKSEASLYFERFYDAFPKHVSKKAAEKKFDVLIKSGISPDQIIAAAGRYAGACKKAGLEKQFIKAPDVWLNKGCYLDEDLPSQPRASPKHLNGFAAVLSEIEEAEMRVNEQFGKNNGGQNDIGASASDALQIGKQD